MRVTRACSLLGLVAAFLGGLVAAADPAPKLAVAIQHEVSGPAHVFVVEATTDLPDGTRVEGTLYFVRRTKEGEEQEVSLETGRERAEKGRVAFRLGHYLREPYAGVYRGRATVEPEGQPPETLARLGAEPLALVATTDLKFGDPAGFEKQAAAVKEEIHQDFKLLRDLFRDLRPRVTALYPLPEPQTRAWLEGNKEWLARLAAIRERNSHRIDADISWVEAYGKRYIDMLADDLKDIERAIGNELDKPAGERRKLAELMREVTTNFTVAWEAWMSNLGLVAVGDAAGLESGVTDVRRLADELGTWLGRRRESASAAQARAYWPTRGPAFETELQAALVRLSGMSPDMAFADVSALTRDARALFAACTEAATRPDDDPALFARATQLQESVLASLGRLEEIARKGK